MTSHNTSGENVTTHTQPSVEAAPTTTAATDTQAIGGLPNDEQQTARQPSLGKSDLASSTTSPPNKSSLGPRVRMRPLLPSGLPAHADLEQLQSGGELPDLQAFVGEVLSEASSFMTEYLPTSFAVKSDSKPASPSKASVKTFAKDIPETELPQSARTGSPETWFARTSVHDNKKENGTAEWAEFEAGLLDNHSQHEMDYTPEVYDAHEVLNWGNSTRAVDGYDKVKVSIYEMAHKIPPPLNNRVFSVVIVTARSTSNPSSFIVIQIPVDIPKVPKALYSNGRNKKDGDSAMKKKDVTLGQYVSIERCEVLDDGAKVKWQMATASDAKGVLPMWAQKMAVPGAIVKDVSFFMEWTENRRIGK